MRWVAGLYYLNIDAHAKDGLLGSTGSLFSGVFGLSATGVDPLADRTLKTDSTSVFGQIEYDFTAQWTVVIGARGIQEKQDYDLQYYAAANEHDYEVDSTPIFPLPYGPFTDERTEDLWAGKLQLEYRPTDGTLWFIGVNRGVKAGSYNAKIFDGTPNISPSEIPYDPEVLVSYEGGVKWSPSQLPVSVNATVFHYDYSDYQAFLFTTNTGVVQNVDADTNGLELQINALLGDNLRATVGYAYTDAEIPDFEIAPGVFKDVQPTFTSEHAAALQLRYSVPADVFSGRVEVGGSVTYSSSFFHNLRNFDADELDGRTLANASVSWSSADDHWGVTGYVKNISDERYATVGFNSAANCGCSIESYGMPRTYGVSLNTQF
jgi:iron complex outermembrane receptor protein